MCIIMRGSIGKLNSSCPVSLTGTYYCKDEGWKLFLQTSLNGIDTSHKNFYTIVTLPAYRIGQRWGATRAVYRIQQEQHMVLLFFYAPVETQSVKPRGQGAEPLGV